MDVSIFIRYKTNSGLGRSWCFYSGSFVVKAISEYIDLSIEIVFEAIL